MRIVPPLLYSSLVATLLLRGDSLANRVTFLGSQMSKKWALLK